MAHMSPESPPSWLDVIGSMRKAIVSSVMAGLIALTQLLTISGGELGNINAFGWITVLVAMLSSGGLTYAIPNKVLGQATPGYEIRTPLQIEAPNKK